MAKRFVFALFTIVFGAFAGVFAWSFFFLMNTSIGFLWGTVPEWFTSLGLPALCYPIVFCAIGGLVIGLFTEKFGSYPEDMNAVLAKVKATGRYEYDHIGSSFVGALLPLMFGGSLGPEAGITGVIAGLCTWVGDRLRFVGSEMRELAESGTAAVVSAIFATPLFGMAVPLVGAADESDGQKPISEVRLGTPKALKITVYILAVAGALGMMALLGSIFGGNGGLPHFAEISIGANELLWVFPCIVVGALAGWVFYPCGAFAARIAKALQKHPLIQPILAGVILGACGIVLPYAMFAGEMQTEELAEVWMSFSAIALIATGFVKMFATQLCLNLGWRGGHFFPIIFAGISIGYGMAALTGIDPVFALCAVTAALMGAVMRQPVMAALLLFLVFPVKSVLVLLVASALGSLIPVPKSWMPQKRKTE